MPHIIIKLWPGRSEEEKKKLADKISETVMETLNVEERTISIALEEVSREKWEKEVYKPDILGKEHTLYKKPGYQIP
jgi:4-oxalocrotonate tautomerase